ncbi:MAG: M23 family metallopeptidase [Thermodesulfobacteriota bacterium]
MTRLLKNHPAAVIVLLSLCITFIGIRYDKKPRLPPAADQRSQPVPMLLQLDEQPSLATSPVRPGAEAEPPAPRETVLAGELERGEGFAAFLGRLGLSGERQRQIIDLLDDHLDFRRLRPGQRLEVTLDPEGDLAACRFEAGALETYTVCRTGDRYETKRLPVELVRETVRLTGTVERSLFEAFEAQGLSHALLFAFVDIFGSAIDFNTEPQPGDRFALVVERYRKGEETVGFGQILAARYENEGKIHEGYAYTSQGETLYFDARGESVGTTFLRSPVPFGRVTSTFTRYRKHPILGGIRPHLGVDFAAPSGTPIQATAGGVVDFAGYNGGYGKQVIVAHAGGFKTSYAHLSRFASGIKRGSRVQQKDIIGFVGSTGMSTGPHVDYRIEENGTFRDPLSHQFRPRLILGGKDRTAFQQLARNLGSRLATGSDSRILDEERLLYRGESPLKLL